MYQCACSTVSFVVLGIANLKIANLVDISFFREGEMHFMEDFIKTYFWKGYKYDEIVLLLENPCANQKAIISEICKSTWIIYKKFTH